MPHMLNVFQQSVALGDTEGAKHVFDVFETLLILVSICVYLTTLYLIWYRRRRPCLAPAFRSSYSTCSRQVLTETSRTTFESRL